MKKILYILLLIFCTIFPLIVNANSIDSIDMNIYVDNEGNAHVTETWNANLNQGTEGYKPYYNLGNAKITDFKVSENGNYYTYEDYWNPNGSFSSKAYKNGINYISNGVELCWGISDYGYHNYVLEYVIEGFVATNEDSDMIYWTLIPHQLSSKPGNVHIKIYSDEPYSQELPVWGYGNFGTAYVYDGYIEMNSEGILNSDEYMTILVKFDKGTFNTNNIISNNFEYYHNMADKGAIENPTKTSISVLRIVVNIVFQLFFWGTLIYVLYHGFRNTKNIIGTKKLDFGSSGRTLPDDVPIYRDIPFNKDIFRTFWIAESYYLNNKKTDFLGAILLKWLKEQKIAIKKVKAGIFKNREATAIYLKDDFLSDNSLEVELYKMMKKASNDGILESKEFEKWCRKNYHKILSWFDNVIDYETSILMSEGKISQIEKVNLKIFKSKVLVVDSSMKEEAIKLEGLSKFLKEFSRIDKKEAIEVSIWEYYLIYAQILGIADKVAKQFKKLYPELFENKEYSYNFDDIIFIQTISRDGIDSAISSRSRANSYSSGGGGYSSGGGGGGSFGGGGGGGGFR